MKLSPPPNVPGQTEVEKFDNAVRAILTVPKEALLTAEERWNRARTGKKRRTKKTA